jgi:hypothetical protein
VIGGCIKLEVLRTPEFQKWAADNVILVELDYQEIIFKLQRCKIRIMKSTSFGCKVFQPYI